MRRDVFWHARSRIKLAGVTALGCQGVVWRHRLFSCRASVPQLSRLSSVEAAELGEDIGSRWGGLVRANDLREVTCGPYDHALCALPLEAYWLSLPEALRDQGEHQHVTVAEPECNMHLTCLESGPTRPADDPRCACRRHKAEEATLGYQVRACTFPFFG